MIFDFGHWTLRPLVCVFVANFDGGRDGVWIKKQNINGVVWWALRSLRLCGEISFCEGIRFFLLTSVKILFILKIIFKQLK